ncbi:MAG: Uma2 family endonuclease [Phormidium sp. BM_Day4_Bin.17]|nr:Uma2 family endonuclease [Phormidium sp. BM_Day4_Bin.17]UCJ13772.1 MAG: Uma2 family endonuclease [Phormidium sp. PBR-2020]
MTHTLQLNLPNTVKFHVTPEQFAAIATHNRDLRLERTATGELIVNPPTGGETGKRNINISGQLYRWYEDNDYPGEVFDSSTGFTLPDGAILSPDASWVSSKRWETLTTEQRESFPPICPDFVVELRSKSDALKLTQAKMQEYLANGTRLGWLIDPKRQVVEIYRTSAEPEALSRPANLSGEDVLPGFVLKLDRIWT